MFGITGRFFPIVSTSNGRILNQKFKASNSYREHGKDYQIAVDVRFDDECNNGHESFSMTADITENRRFYMSGCCHDEIAKHFPSLAKLVKWHLSSTDGPMHYIANTLYHAVEHGPTHAWVYYTGTSMSDPLRLSPGETKERLLGYFKAAKAKEAEGKPGYRVEWDEKTIKVANFDHARSSAIWPEATVEQLRDKEQLAARLPGLLAEFHADMVAAGFEWPQRMEIAA